MHPTQLEILDSLRQSDSRKFSELLSEVAETSDNLTYHLKRLLKDSFIESPEKGEYKLAENGLKYLNNNLELNHDLFPTVSCMLELYNAQGDILVMKKLKQPFLGRLHLPTFGVTSETSLEDQIDMFLEKYHIQAGGLSFKCNYRERAQSNEELFIFDKLFVVFRGTFTTFEPDIEDREFLILTKNELLADQMTLAATKTVLDLDAGVYSEVIRHEA